MRFLCSAGVVYKRGLTNSLAMTEKVRVAIKTLTTFRNRHCNARQESAYYVKKSIHK